MITYIHIIFTGGSCGNLLTRCLNLLTNFHCHVHKTNNTFPTDIKSKFELLNYASVINRRFNQRNWIEFESKYNQCEYNYINNGYIVLMGHVCHITKQLSYMTTDPNNKIIKFYINPFNNIEWVIKNALYKNTPTEIGVIMEGKFLLGEPNINLINLENIIDGADTFWQEILHICNLIGYLPRQIEQDTIIELYNQWLLTVFDDSKIIEFNEDELAIFNEIVAGSQS